MTALCQLNAHTQYHSQIPFPSRECFHAGGFYSEKQRDGLYCYATFSHDIFFKPAMWFVSVQRVLPLILSVTHILLLGFVNTPPLKKKKKQPQDFACGSQSTNSFDCLMCPAIFTGSFTVVGIVQHMSVGPEAEDESQTAKW